MALLSLFGDKQSSVQKSSLAPLTFRPWLETLESRDCPSITAPTGLQLTALSPTQVRMSWNDVVGEQGYRIYEWDGVSVSLVNSPAADTITYYVNQLSAYHQYYFLIEAFDEHGSARSDWVSVTTPQDPITAPRNARISATNFTQLSLGWGSATGATGYRILQAIDNQWVAVASLGASHG